MAGPLAGVRVVELAGIGPGPFAGMLLADLGAEIIRVDRAADLGGDELRALAHAVIDRGRRSIAVDLKQPAGREVVLALAERADVIIEGFRPGVAERLGVGPEDVAARNPRLVYGRMTGWGQSGPYAHLAGHDLNYIAAAGALALGRGADGVPVPPENVLGDFGGGSLYLVTGILAALLHARETGRGQVVDAAIVDGAASLMAMHHAMINTGVIKRNPMDGGAPYYRVYRTADDRFLAVAAMEPQFWAELLDGLGLADRELPDRDDPANWPELGELFAEIIRGRPLADWLAAFEGRDACVTAVCTPGEAPHDPHLAARRAYLPAGADGAGWQPAPAPRLSVTEPELPGPPPRIGQHTDEVLAELGIDADALRAAGVVG
ncbi:CoA transferase [Naumannella cuiyingiana]|uniref:Alpha-methylacyl-CoA racemase n=1 Tax=Naumannella cuiyingiana TaxID=1347891 RepID=A0A7Z0D897_9ACTN|nr:alpha-methylacyl-CoA racemase [Naumannella cuiyingiana]